MIGMRIIMYIYIYLYLFISQKPHICSAPIPQQYTYLKCMVPDQNNVVYDLVLIISQKGTQVVAPYPGSPHTMDVASCS